MKTWAIGISTYGSLGNKNCLMPEVRDELVSEILAVLADCGFGVVLGRSNDHNLVLLVLEADDYTDPETVVTAVHNRIRNPHFAGFTIVSTEDPECKDHRRGVTVELVGHPGKEHAIRM